ncbi:hypothetical protein L798_09516 [Zootermopsis nevadensis]|uniref:BESS domain-containing protein n=1 Tax=Zootermopsis nevadensis TaxID=136037 RepID=A0A067QP91_ZOONE|nr:hypothetical protein L798_09516 [Zootermopsis nevadensis]
MPTGSAEPPTNSNWDFSKGLQFLEPSTSNLPANAQFQTQTENNEGCPDEASQSSVPQPPPQKRRNNNYDYNLDYLVKRDAMQQLRANTATEIEDDIALFGNYVKAVLRKLHPRMTIQAKNDLYNILSEYEVKQLDMQERTRDKYI